MTTPTPAALGAGSRRLDVEPHFWGMFVHGPFGLMFSDEQARIRMANRYLSVLLGYEPGDLVGISVPELVDSADRSEVIAARADLAEGRVLRTEGIRHFIRADGATTAVRVTTFVAHDDHGVDRGHVSIVVDLSETVRLSAALEQAAEVDQLTGLASRLALRRDLTRAGRHTDPTVIFVDLDGFGSINTAFGGDTGDAVLIEIARRLQSCAPAATVARVGGDEFAIAYSAITDSGGATATLTDRVRRALAEPVDTPAGLLWVSASIGICDGALPAKNGIERLQRAETAAAAAKRAGSGTALSYDPTLNRSAVERARLEPLLRAAIDEDRVIVHYQPIVSLDTGSVTGFEALARLRSPDGTLVPPDVFIPAAETTGMIVPIGAHILRTACRRATELRKTVGNLTMSVNVSARQAARPDFVDTVLHALSDSLLPPTALTLELTESILLSATPETTHRLEQLRDLGIGIALDDFGTGYSSLTYLRTFPITRVKIDKSFTDHIADDRISAGIIHGVTMIAKDLDLSWVAEGIETVEQKDALATLGPGYGQGYLFARPLPHDEIRHFLAAPCPGGEPRLGP